MALPGWYSVGRHRHALRAVSPTRFDWFRKLFSASTELKNWPASSFGAWTHFVNLRNGKTLFYRASTGEGAIGEFTSGAPYFTQLGGFVANTFPKEMDIVSAL
ncbi:MAG: hypothetical protein IPI67_39805 [Myxococcales bacterium]|nr:hypothetical protein [Myxococcales bacterium]